jgi:hypothetical protein
MLLPHLLDRDADALRVACSHGGAGRTRACLGFGTWMRSTAQSSRGFQCMASSMLRSAESLITS